MKAKKEIEEYNNYSMKLNRAFKNKLSDIAKKKG